MPPFFCCPQTCLAAKLDKLRGSWYAMRGKMEHERRGKMNKCDFDYLLLFSSPSCPQCRGLKESLKKTGLEYEESNNYEGFNVEHLPTLILMESKKFHRHEEQKRHVGYMTPDELNEFVKHSSCGRRMVNE